MHGATPETDEELSPSLENFVVFTWLQLSTLDSYVCSPTELRSRTLASIKPEACRTRELSAELTVTRGYWRKQNPPVCGEILRVFRHACQKSFKILPHTGGNCLRQCSRVTVS